jgi:hypothetical protein
MQLLINFIAIIKIQLNYFNQKLIPIFKYKKKLKIIMLHLVNKTINKVKKMKI